MEGGSGPPGYYSLAARAQPGGEGARVESRLYVFREIDTRLYPGVAPAQLTSRQPPFADRLGADEWIPHAEIVEEPSDETGLEAASSA